MEPVKREWGLGRAQSSLAFSLAQHHAAVLALVAAQRWRRAADAAI